ncbi:MAG: DNA polymerase III subunit delta [Catonella sp.]|uniref:DNA polymerase III subunit delta n=1 Tax=Catonella sp. TaxID=2382125 RepID=UPI003FA17769
MSEAMLKEHIKTHSFKRCYLLYGEEPYMVRHYKNALKKAVLGDSDKMNLSTFSGKVTDINNIIELAETLPFFSDYRCILIENSGLFSSANELSEYIARIPETTVIIFSETEVDKRTKLYKAVHKNGFTVEFDIQKENDLINTIIKKFTANNISINYDLAKYFVIRIGLSMDELFSEANKLIAYVYENKIVTKEDIDYVCPRQLSDRIFDLMDYIGKKELENAISLYLDLINLQESPIKILSLINTHFYRLHYIKQWIAEGKRGELAKLLKINPYFMPKYMEQSKNFSDKTLKDALEYGIFVDNAIKTGEMNEYIAVESLIIKFSV